MAPALMAIQPKCMACPMDMAKWLKEHQGVPIQTAPIQLVIVDQLPRQIRGRKQTTPLSFVRPVKRTSTFFAIYPSGGLQRAFKSPAFVRGFFFYLALQCARVIQSLFIDRFPGRHAVSGRFLPRPFSWSGWKFPAAFPLQYQRRNG